MAAILNSSGHLKFDCRCFGAFGKKEVLHSGQLLLRLCVTRNMHVDAGFVGLYLADSLIM